jgi:hypothetical protein
LNDPAPAGDLETATYAEKRLISARMCQLPDNHVRVEDVLVVIVGGEIEQLDIEPLMAAFLRRVEILASPDASRGGASADGR